MKDLLKFNKIARQTLGNRSFSVMGRQPLNNIPNEVKECANIQTFKKVKCGYACPCFVDIALHFKAKSESHSYSQSYFQAITTEE